MSLVGMSLGVRERAPASNMTHRRYSKQGLREIKKRSSGYKAEAPRGGRKAPGIDAHRASESLSREARFFAFREMRLALISLLASGPRHGYGIMKDLRERPGSRDRWSAASTRLYVARRPGSRLDSLPELEPERHHTDHSAAHPHPQTGIAPRIAQGFQTRMPERRPLD